MAVVIKHILTSIIAAKILMKLKPYRPHIIYQNSHRNTRRNNLSLMMQNPNPRWDFHFPPNHRMAKPNLSSAICPHAIFQA